MATPAVGMGVKPSLSTTLDALVAGRVVYIQLDREQNLAFHDPDGKLALNVVRHLLAARRTVGASSDLHEPFPLTEGAFVATARRLGSPVGIKKARSLRRRLLVAKVIDFAGGYRPQYRTGPGDGAHRVPLYRLVVAAKDSPARRGPCASHKVVVSVGRGLLGKPARRRRWYEHELFGTPDGKPPPQLTRRQRRMWRSADERTRTWR
jgi:hypothetical protein